MCVYIAIKNVFLSKFLSKIHIANHFAKSDLFEFMTGPLVALKLFILIKVS